MSAHYGAIGWNRRKLAYDVCVAAGAGAYLYAFRALARGHGLSAQVVSMRALGSLAFVMLTAILCIGPLARLDRRFLPVLYNRRHFGVMMAIVALLHAREMLQFHLAYGRPSPLASLLVYDTTASPAALPFPLLGALGLAIVLVMAATSHDFWQGFLGGAAWKWLHMSVYAAYGLLVLHVAFGALVSERATAPVVLVALSVALVAGLHLLTAWRAQAIDVTPRAELTDDGETWLDAGALTDFRVGRARPLSPPGAERIAVVRTDAGLSAVHGVCAHQGGPLTEARVLDGCLTCPWHGWQYKPEDGCAPPPFVEKIPTYRVKVRAGRVLVDPRPLPAGTLVAPAKPEEVAE